MSALSSKWCRYCYTSDVGNIIWVMPALSEQYWWALSLRAMCALSSEHGGQYHTSDINYSSNVSTTIRVVSTLCCVEYSRPLSCMGKTIWMMSLVQCYKYQSGIGIIIRAWWAISALPLRWEQYYAVWSIRDLWVVWVKLFEWCC